MWQRLAVLVLLLWSVSLVQAAPTTPTADFTDNGDGTVTHKITGLTWKRCAEGMTWTGTTCGGTVQTYTWSQANALTSGGWRLPTIAELVTIVERENVNRAINTTIFPNTPSSYFWSASAYVGHLDFAWHVNFGDGGDGHGLKADYGDVRLVRGGQLLDSLGLYTPNSDFSDNGDGSVTHKKSNLTWKRCAEGQAWSGSACSGTEKAVTWVEANALSAGGWRLPTIAELLTIVEWSKTNPLINPEIFPKTASSCFWSASAYAHYSDFAWCFDFDLGYDYPKPKANGYYVRLVRKGQSGGTSTPSDAERVFNWAESAYAQYFFPAKPPIQETQGFTYRYYTGSGNYLAVKDGKLWLAGPLSQNQLFDAGSLADWLSKAKAAGY